MYFTKFYLKYDFDKILNHSKKSLTRVLRQEEEIGSDNGMQILIFKLAGVLLASVWLSDE